MIGDPIDRSLSPVMHNSTLREMGLGDEFVYEKIRVERDELEAFVQGLRDGDYHGANVTIPHKVEVMRYMDRLTDAVEKIGAVNTIYKENGMLVGDNTDHIGFIRSLKDEGVDVEDRHVTVIGAGGAARAIIYALLEGGAESILIANRTRENAVRIMERFDHLETQISVGGLDEVHGDILVNTTPLGMAGELENRSPIPVDRITPNVVAVDIVYDPPKTRFLKAAQKRGCKTVSGIGMLIYQGAVALEKWTGKKVPVDTMKEAVIRKMKDNIALIGFMGTGKSTVGVSLADSLGRDFIEVDELIEEKADKTIEKIFREDGEEHFRTLESEIIQDVCQKEDTVISCGGGVVLDRRNSNSLKKNAYVVLLTASTEEILRRLSEDSSRPLLRCENREERIKELLDDRSELYDDCAHITIDTSDRGIDSIVDEIIRRKEGWS